MSDQAVRWGIIGPGSISHKFVQGLQVAEGAVLTAVASRTLDRAQTFANQYGFARAYGSYEALTADPDVDAVYIGTLHSFHKSHTMLCLEHGKHVICEKPFAINANEAAEMVALARQKGVVLMDGGGFDSPEMSVRVSLANLPDKAYVTIGKAISELLKEYYDHWLVIQGK